MTGVVVTSRVPRFCSWPVWSRHRLRQGRRGALSPTGLKRDTRPLPAADGAYAFGIVDQEVPGLSAGVDDVVVGVPNPGAELVLTQIVPDVFHWVQLGTVGRQGEQSEIGRHLQLLASLMPASP